MLLPLAREDRYPFYRNLIREVGVSRDERRALNRRRRQRWLTGSDTAEQARYNKLREHCSDLAADLYSPDTVRFSVVYAPHYGDRWLEEVEAARDEMHRLWHDTNAGLVFNLGVESAPSWGTSVFKVFTDRNEPAIDLVDPADIGVSRESLNDWDRQEALCHWYEISLPVFRRMIAVLPDAERRERLWNEAQDHAVPSQSNGMEALGPAAARLILSASSPTMTGVTNMATVNPAQPTERVDVVQMAELWVWDDEAVALCDTCHKAEHDLIHRKDLPTFVHSFKAGGGWDGDYRVVTLVCSSATEPILWEPHNPLISGEHPFHDLTIDPVYGYIWGLSQVDELYPLQAWREARMNGIDELMGKQVDPPIVGVGVQGTQDEKLGRLRKRGGTVSFPQSGNTKIEPFLIPMPADAFGEINEIDKMFDHAAGRRSRQREAGTRSGDQVMAEARLAGGPTRNKAMIVEKSLESIATAMLRLHRKTNKTTLTAISGREFLLSQMPGDFVVRVDAHSSSPLYHEELMSKVAFAAKEKWLDPDEGLDLMNFPNAEVLKPKARRRAAAQAEVSKKAMELKELETTARGLRAIEGSKK